MTSPVTFTLEDANAPVVFVLAETEAADVEFRFEPESASFSFALAEAVPGPPGEGATVTVDVEAGETLSGHRAVVIDIDGKAYYASNDDPGDVTRQVWLTLGAAIEGTQVTLQPIGIVTEPSWNWSDAPVFLGTNGVLTQEPPVAPAFMLLLGQPTGATSLMFNPRTPIVL